MTGERSLISRSSPLAARWLLNFITISDGLITREQNSLIAKCANPSCNRDFRELNKGRLYLLPPPVAVRRLIDHCYWLCPECDLTYIIERFGAEPGIRVLLRSPPVQLPVTEPQTLPH